MDSERRAGRRARSEIASHKGRISGQPRTCASAFGANCGTEQPQRSRAGLLLGCDGFLRDAGLEGALERAAGCGEWGSSELGEDRSTPGSENGAGGFLDGHNAWLSLAMVMSHAGAFHTGQPVWVIEPDESQRPAEYIGEGSPGGASGGERQAFVIYVDSAGSDVVDLERLLPREPQEAARKQFSERSTVSVEVTAGDERPGRRGGSSGGAAVAAHMAGSRAVEAHERRQAAVFRQAELAERVEDPTDLAREAGTRAKRAARAAEVAQVRAAEAHARSAEAHESAARMHERVAQIQDERGHARAAAEHRRHAANARTAAKDAARAAQRCRQTL